MAWTAKRIDKQPIEKQCEIDRILPSGVSLALGSSWRSLACWPLALVLPVTRSSLSDFGPCRDCSKVLQSLKVMLY